MTIEKFIQENTPKRRMFSDNYVKPIKEVIANTGYSMNGDSDASLDLFLAPICDTYFLITAVKDEEYMNTWVKQTNETIKESKDKINMESFREKLLSKYKSELRNHIEEAVNFSILPN